MLVIDSDILIDAARNDATATRFLATAISHHAALASKNRRHFRALTELTLIAYPPT